MRCPKRSRRFLVLAVICLGLLARQAQAADEDLRLVQVRDVVVDRNSNEPVVLLEEKEEGRLLPIWIGPAQARAILMELQGVAPPRPMTHDLMRSVISALGGEILRVVVTEIKGGTYFAFIEMRAAGRTFSVDSRPSDAIALALRVKSPIYVRPVVMRSGIRMRREHTHRERLGLALQKMTPALARFFGDGAVRGLLVSQVREGAPAARAGLRRGDVILEAQGERTDTLDAFERVFVAHPGGIVVSVRRTDGKTRRFRLGGSG